MSINNQEKKMIKFQDLQILQNLQTTHQGNTKLYVVRYQGQLMVCKSISKNSFIDGKSVQHVKNQKQALLTFTKQNCKYINHLINTFQDKQNIYMLLKLVQGLPLHKLIQMSGSLSVQMTRLIVSQVGLIMNQLHKNGYVYRDIKASNFMINSKGKVTMIDLGKAKLIGQNGKAFTICGTTHSMPLEIYKKQGYGFQFDYYSFGVLIYELLTAKSPFGYEQFSQEYMKKLQIGLNEQIMYPIICPITKNLITNLMCPKQTRLGNKNGFQQILSHEYFNCLQFLDYKDILQDEGQIDMKDDRYSFYISEVIDFGLQRLKYNQVNQDDPFYKFYNCLQNKQKAEKDQIQFNNELQQVKQGLQKLIIY